MAKYLTIKEGRTPAESVPVFVSDDVELIELGVGDVNGAVANGAIIPVTAGASNITVKCDMPPASTGTVHLVVLEHRRDDALEGPLERDRLHVIALERLVGVQLFDRKPHALSLTS